MYKLLDLKKKFFKYNILAQDLGCTLLFPRLCLDEHKKQKHLQEVQLNTIEKKKG